jgi:hypothetical protein
MKDIIMRHKALYGSHYMQMFSAWRKRRQAIRLCHRLYQQSSGFHLAQLARAQQQLFSYEYIYGEIDFLSFSQLLKRCQIKPNNIFYDLGSGIGKAVVCAALLYDFKKICGIEQLKLLHEQALHIQQSSKILASRNINFYQADLLTFDWQDADILFVNASAFIGDFWEQVLTQLLKLKTGSQIIVVSKLLPANHFTQIYSDFIPMSWGLARAGIYLR